MTTQESGQGFFGAGEPEGGELFSSMVGQKLQDVLFYASRKSRNDSMANLLTLPELDEKTSEQLDTPWQVVVLNDPVNLMSYVVLVFRKVFGYSVEKARQHMLEVHRLGRSIVWTGEREQAEMYVHTLQQWQLTAILQHDD